MAEQANIFDKLILEGKIASVVELRRYYRSLAARVHPDISRLQGSHEAFLRLKKDYEAAVSKIGQGGRGGTGKKAAPTREEIYHAFWDIEASGFPVDPSIRDSSRAYGDRIESFSRQLRAYGALPDHGFEEIERELYEIRGDDIIDNPLFGKIRMIFYNIISWHQDPKAFTKAALAKWRSEIVPELEARNLRATKAFLTWLMDDIKNGKAL